MKILIPLMVVMTILASNLQVAQNTHVLNTTSGPGIKICGRMMITQNGVVIKP
jgi:hypothetical protein